MWITIEWGRGPSPRRLREAEAVARREQARWRADVAARKVEIAQQYKASQLGQHSTKRPWRNGSA